MADSNNARLTTHVLDVSLGRPAAGIAVHLVRIEAGGRTRVADAVTNADGRCDEPLLAGKAFVVGEYDLIFAAGPYLDATGPHRDAAGQSGAHDGSGVRFLSDIVIRFGMAEMTHYHVPLLLSPFGYSTYRGS